LPRGRDAVDANAVQIVAVDLRRQRKAKAIASGVFQIVRRQVSHRSAGLLPRFEAAVANPRRYGNGLARRARAKRGGGPVGDVPRRIVAIRAANRL
jgi:hypothetical protein